MTLKEFHRRSLVEPGTPAALASRDPAWTGSRDPASRSGARLKARAESILAKGVNDLADAQELLRADDRYALLVVFQAMDAAGKDSTVKHVLSGVNPQGVKVVSFKQPSREELDHDFLWRVSRELPARGQIGVFNRSHYEEVLAVRVHPEWLDAQKLPPGPRDEAFWQDRLDDINAFERHLDRSATRVVKFFLHVSKAEQKRRFLARLDEPHKAWKFSPEDVKERRFWDAYHAAYEEAISATSTPWAPWYVIPADHKPVMHALVASILVTVIQSLPLRWPNASPEAMERFSEARRLLETEEDV